MRNKEQENKSIRRRDHHELQSTFCLHILWFIHEGKRKRVDYRFSPEVFAGEGDACC